MSPHTAGTAGASGPQHQPWRVLHKCRPLRFRNNKQDAEVRQMIMMIMMMMISKVLQHKASPWTKETQTSHQNSRLSLDANMSRQTGFNMEVSAPEHAG